MPTCNANGSCTLNANSNIQGVARTAAGVYTVTFATALAGANYLVVCTAEGTGGWTAAPYNETAASFTIEINRPNSGDFAGQFKIALMPGSSHATVGYVRFYAMTGAVAKKGKDYLDGAWKFLEYFAGKTSGQYVVVKRWAVENGLGFAQLPLFADADVRAAFGKWGDIATISEQAKLARSKEGLTPWYGTWDIFLRAEVQKVILGQ